MSIEVAPATLDRFDDVATMVGPKNPKSSVCWCLSHRIDAKTNRELIGPARGELQHGRRRPVAGAAVDEDQCHGAVAPTRRRQGREAVKDVRHAVLADYPDRQVHSRRSLGTTAGHVRFPAEAVGVEAPLTLDASAVR